MDMKDWTLNKGTKMPVFDYDLDYISLRFRGIPGYITVTLKTALEQDHWTWVWKGKPQHGYIEQYRQQGKI